MIAKSRSLFQVACASLLLTCSTAAWSQESSAGPTFLEAHCMKARSGDYVDVETELWQPVHQELIKQGKKSSWALYSVRYGDRSHCSHYTIEIYQGSEQFQYASSGAEYAAAFAKVHPDLDMVDIDARTMAARDMNESLLWVSEDSTVIGDFMNIQVNWMHTDDPASYVKMEREIFKPLQEAAIQGGYLAGWALYRLASPTGSDIPFNYVTVDLHNAAVRKWPPESLWRKVHPNLDMNETVAKMEATRTMVRSESWDLIARTKPLEQ